MKGIARLPEESEMREDSLLKIWRNKDAHFPSNPWYFAAVLANDGQFLPLPIYYPTGYDLWIHLMNTYPKTFREFDFKVDVVKESIKIVKDDQVFLRKNLLDEF